MERASGTLLGLVKKSLMVVASSGLLLIGCARQSTTNGPQPASSATVALENLTGFPLYQNSKVLSATAFSQNISAAQAAYSPLTEWPHGGVVGVHGPYGALPSQIPGRISHGCIRLRVGDDFWLGRHLEVGTPLRVI